MLSDEQETAQTIAYMEELSAFDAGERSVIAATHRALTEGGITQTSSTPEIANAFFWWLKRNITYVPTPGAGPLVDQTLIAPSALMRMDPRIGDCPQFSMLAASMFRVACVPVNFKTIAADARYPEIYSHVYNVVALGDGRYLPFDSSNGPAPGAEYAAAFKSRIWPRTIPDRCADPKRIGYRSVPPSRARRAVEARNRPS